MATCAKQLLIIMAETVGAEGRFSEDEFRTESRKLSSTTPSYYLRMLAERGYITSEWVHDPRSCEPGEWYWRLTVRGLAEARTRHAQIPRGSRRWHANRRRPL